MAIKKIELPVLAPTASNMMSELLMSLNIPRDVLASDENIAYAWGGLPRQLNDIPMQYRSDLLARMCIAVYSGLFDSAINYIWNIGITALREKVKHFGLAAVSQIIATQFDEDKLFDLRDSELLELCLTLNLITEEGYFFLDQNRDMRNNFSAAHPSIGTLNDTELLAFLNRTVQHALKDESNPKGVDLQGLIKAIQGGRFTNEQRDYWINSIKGTHEAQRQTILTTVHGIYCDPALNEYARLNAIDLSKLLRELLTPKIESALIDRHSEYNAKGDVDRHTASRAFFTSMERIGLLTEAERHSIVTNCAKRLMSAHQDLNNFYNEPPFAEQLSEIALQAEVPTSAKHSYVSTVVICYIGNGYGVSRAALSYYENMIRSFSALEIAHMLNSSKDKNGLIGIRINRSYACKNNFIKAVDLLDPQSIPAALQSEYNFWATGLK